jgi:hypothetical protein
MGKSLSEVRADSGLDPRSVFSDLAKALVDQEASRAAGSVGAAGFIPILGSWLQLEGPR